MTDAPTQLSCEPLVQTVIQPPSGWAAIDFREIWHYRELLWIFLLRDIKTRYKQSALGPFWVIFPPLLSSGIFTVIFGGLVDMPTDGVPPFLFIFSAMMAWTFFASSFEATSHCLAVNENIFTKVYFPRLVMPLANSISKLVDTLITGAVLLIAMIVLGVFPTWRILLAPFFLLIGLGLGIGMGLWVAALGVKYRDVRQGSVLVVRFFQWLAPIAYTSQWVFESQSLPEWVKLVYKLNPLYWVADGFRWSVLSIDRLTPDFYLAISATLVFLFLFPSMYFFKKVEANFADTV